MTSLSNEEEKEFQISSVSELQFPRSQYSLDQNSFHKIYFLFNSKLNGQKLRFNTPLSCKAASCLKIITFQSNM